MFGQRDIKRLLAYSSVEHMGILAIGVSFGAPIALAGVLLHVLAHAAAKGNAFMGAGVFTVKYGTKQMSAMRDGLRLLPWSGPLFLLAIFALSALPPFGIFRSEFEIVAGGLGSGSYAAAAILVVLVTVAFFGLATSATSVLLAPVPAGKRRGAGARRDGGRRDRRRGAHGKGDAHADGAAAATGPAAAERDPDAGEPSAWMVVPVLAGLAVLVLLGVHPPGELTNLITQAAAQLEARHDRHSTEPTVAALEGGAGRPGSRAGMRFAGVFAARRDGGITLSAHVAGPDGSTRSRRRCRRARPATRRSPR